MEPRNILLRQGTLAGFAVETLSGLGVSREICGKNSNRHAAVETGVAGAVDFSHAAHAERRLDFGRPESGAGGESHPCAKL